MRVELHVEAELELLEASTWYELQGAGLGDDLIAEMDAALETVGATADTWPRWPDAPERSPAIRRFLLPRFPYALAYQVFDDCVIVLAIAHTSKAPFYWAARSR